MASPAPYFARLVPMMKKLFRPKVLIPVILAAAVIAALLAFADVRKVLALMAGFNRLYLVYFMLLMVAYEGVRCVQWHYLLTHLGVRVPLRTQVFAFALGEVTKSLPIGNYFQNYLLTESKGTDFGFSSAVTTLIVLIEVAVSLLGVVIIGLGSFTPWLRPLIIVGVLIFGVVAWIVYKLHNAASAPKWMKERKSLRKALDELRNFRKGAVRILTPKTLAVAMLLGAIYLIIAGVALYVVARGLDVNVSVWDALAVYFFSLAIGLIFPLPIDVGVLEISGVGAFLAVGVSKTAAVGITLINRVLSILAAIAIAIIVASVLHGEFRAALRERSSRRGAQGTPKSPETEPETEQRAAAS